MANNSFDPLADRLGSDLLFPINGNFSAVSGVELLLQDMQQLLLTAPGERVASPAYGCGLKSLIWENIDTVVAEGPGIIKSALGNYEPRVRVSAVDVSANRDTGLVNFIIRFTIISTDTNFNLVFPLRAGSDLSST